MKIILETKDSMQKIEGSPIITIIIKSMMNFKARAKQHVAYEKKIECISTNVGNGEFAIIASFEFGVAV